MYFQARIGIEVVFNGPFGMAADNEDFFNTALQGFFHDVLDRRFIDDRQHFFWRRFVAGKKRVPKPAAGMTALRIFFTLKLLIQTNETSQILRQ